MYPIDGEAQQEVPEQQLSVVHRSLMGELDIEPLTRDMISG
jgi:hypothetical protein